MNETIRLADGTEISHAQTIESLQGLWIHIREGLTLAEGYAAFSDAEKTRRMESDKTEPATVYEGYTDLFMIKREEDGKIMIGLKKE